MQCNVTLSFLCPPSLSCTANTDPINHSFVAVRMVLQSFCPMGAFVKKVTIYLSDFGQSRMELEQAKGPQWIWSHEQNDDDEEPTDDADSSGSESDYVDEDEDELANDEVSPDAGGGDFHRRPGSVGLVVDPSFFSSNATIEDDDKDDDDKRVSKSKGRRGRLTAEAKKEQAAVALRAYELSRLRYYFAVADCDTVETADALYSALDGVELEHSSMAFDLRFIPDDVR